MTPLKRAVREIFHEVDNSRPHQHRYILRGFPQLNRIELEPEIRPFSSTIMLFGTEPRISVEKGFLTTLFIQTLCVLPIVMIAYFLSRKIVDSKTFFTRKVSQTHRPSSDTESAAKRSS